MDCLEDLFSLAFPSLDLKVEIAVCLHKHKINVIN